MIDTTLSDGAKPASAHASRPEEGVLGRLTASFGLSLGITSVLSALLVILKETHEDTVLAWMKLATGNHWITHGLLDVVVFVVLGFALARPASRLQSHPMAVLSLALGGVAAGALLVAGFYGLA